MNNFSKTLGDYYHLAKPGIIYGNLITAVAGFLFASRLAGQGFDPQTFFAIVFGTVFIIGSACVFNNYTDRALDARMARTAHRALVKGDISPQNALIYAVVLGAAGFVTLTLYTNILTVCLEFIGLFSYVVLYGLSKRRSVYGVIVGSIPGAMPIVAGYTAAAGHLDLAALILFFILVFWQMPHFYAIALYRADEYAAAGVPILPLVKGIRRTQIEILAYVIAFCLAVASLWWFGYVGLIYIIIMGLVGLGWLAFAVKGFSATLMNSPAKWGRQVFLYSLAVILIFSIMISIAG